MEIGGPVDVDSWRHFDEAEAERMTESNSYASHPEYLPDFMNDPRDDDGRQVVKLSLAEDRELTAASLNRFPAAAGDVIDFESTAYDDRLWWDDEEQWGRMAAELLSPYVQRGERIAVIWGNYVMPVVTMPAEVAVRHARAILNAGPHFWIHPLGSSVLIECLMDGQVTVATIPSGRENTATRVHDRLVDLPEELHDVVQQLRLVFPAGMDESDDDYLPLLVVLDPLVSDEHLGVVVEAAFGVDRHLVRNQAAAALSVKAPALEVVERLRTRMTAGGWSIVGDE